MRYIDHGGYACDSTVHGGNSLPSEKQQSAYAIVHSSWEKYGQNAQIKKRCCEIVLNHTFSRTDDD